MNNDIKEELSDRIGLYNIGNTCFMNVVIQALRQTPQLINLLFNTKIILRDNSKKTLLLRAFHQLIYDMLSPSVSKTSTSNVSPNLFVNDLFKTMINADDMWFRPHQQADSAEMLQYLIDSMHDAMYFKIDMHIRSSYEDTSSEYNALNSWVKYHSKEYSPLVDIFTGQSRNRIVCSECKNASEVFEPWLMLKPVVPKITTPISFTDCMNATFIPETMEDYQCDKCNKRTLATLETAITRTPPITIIAFKRFNNLGRKIRGLINWNIDELDLRPWMAFDSSPFTRHQKLPIYETYAVIEHNGSMQGGHYHMYSRESKNNWVEYDDTGISDVSPERVVSADSYIVFLISKEVRDAEIGRMEKIINVLRNNRGKE